MAYQVAVAGASRAHAADVRTATIQRATDVAAVEHAATLQLNAASRAKGLADSAANLEYDGAQALADKNYSISLDIAQAARDCNRAIAAAEADEAIVRSQASLERSVAKADQQYQKEVAAKGLVWASSVADAQRTSDSLSMIEFNDAIAKADRQLDGDKYAAAAVRAGRVGDAIIAYAADQGLAIVDRTVTYNQAENRYVQKMNSAAVEYHQAIGTADKQIVGRQSTSAVACSSAEVQSELARTQSTGLIDVAYQRAIGSATVARAALVAAAECAYHVAMAQQAVATANAWAARTGATQSDQLQAAATAARCNWLVATSYAYVDYATAQAQGAASYQEAITAAQATANTQQAAARIAHTAQVAVADKAKVLGDTNDQTAVDLQSVIVQNDYDVAAAQAKASLRATYAKAELEKAVALARAQKSYEVATAGANPALADAYASTLENATHTLAVQQALATRDWTQARLAADLDWTKSTVNAEQKQTAAMTQLDYDKGVADAKRAGMHQIALVQAGAVRDVAFSNARSQLARQAATLDGARLWSLAQGEVVWQSAQYAAQSTVSSVLASVSNTPWAAYQAAYATARQQWWAATAGEYLATVSQSNAAAIAYQDAISSATTAQASRRATAEVNAAKALASDELALATAQAAAAKAYQTDLARAIGQYVVGMAQATYDEDQTRAGASYQAVADVGFDLCGATAVATQKRTDDASAAERRYRQSAALIVGANEENLALAYRDYAGASGAHERSRTATVAAVDQEFARCEAAASTMRTTTQAAIGAAYRRTANTRQQATLTALAASTGTPWAALNAARMTALADWSAATEPVAAHRAEVAASAEQAYRVSQAAADALFANSMATANAVDEVAQADASVAGATADAQQIAQQSTQGDYSPRVPDLPEVPAIAFDSEGSATVADVYLHDVALADVRSTITAARPWVNDAGIYRYTDFLDEIGWSNAALLSAGAGPHFLGSDSSQTGRARTDATAGTGASAATELPGAGSEADSADDWDAAGYFADDVEDLAAELQRCDQQQAPAEPAQTEQSYRDLNRYSREDMEELIALGCAIKSSDGKYAAVVDVFGLDVMYYLFERFQPMKSEQLTGCFGPSTREVPDGPEAYRLVLRGSLGGVENGLMRDTHEPLEDYIARRRTTASVDWMVKRLDGLREAQVCQQRLALLDFAHDGLVFIDSMIPIKATVAHAFKGEWSEFALSLAGDAALLLSGGAGSLVKAGKALKCGNAYFNAAKNLHLASGAIQTSLAGYAAGRGMVELFSEDGSAIKGLGYLGEAALRMLGARAEFKQAAGVKALADFPGCFFAGTLVATDAGQQPIELIRPDQQVWAFDLAVGGWSLCRVLEVYENDYVGQAVDVLVDGQRIASTANHPVWVVEGAGLGSRPQPEHVARAQPSVSVLPGRWVDAIDLHVGDVVVLMHGRRATITAVTLRAVAERVYNFQVEGLHNYAVGSCAVLVHNNTACNGANAANAIPQGIWVEESTAGWSPRAKAYQQQITGRPAGTAYKVGDVRFDGIVDGALVDAKGPGYAKLLDYGLGEAKLLKGAKAQVLAVSKGTPITWHVAEQDAANTIRAMFRREGISIKVIFTPPVR